MNVDSLFIGFNLAILSGMLDGSMASPMQLAKSWRWENIWLVYSLFGMLLVPWSFAFFALEDPLHIYELAPRSALYAAFVFGGGWGIGSILFGTGITLAGMSFGYATVVSLTAVLGSLIPMIILNPTKLRTFQGNIIIVALFVLLIGVSLCSLAASRRKEQKPLLKRERTHFLLGLIACVAAGFFSPMLNLAFAFGFPISATALSYGSGDIGASLALLNIVLLAGFVPNVIYSLFLLRKNRTSNEFFQAGSVSNWFYGFLMGLLSFGAFLVYGIANVYLGPMGPVVGWPIYMAVVILTANFWGLIRGEWSKADKKTMILLFSGLSVIVVAIYLVSLGQ